MNPCNYNWNIAILELRKSRIYVSRLYFDSIFYVSYYFKLRVEDQGGGLDFNRKPKERNFRYISNLIEIKMPDSFEAYYYFDNQDNEMNIYFHRKV